MRDILNMQLSEASAFDSYLKPVISDIFKPTVSEDGSTVTYSQIAKDDDTDVLVATLNLIIEKCDLDPEIYSAIIEMKISEDQTDVIKMLERDNFHVTIKNITKIDKKKYGHLVGIRSYTVEEKPDVNVPVTMKKTEPMSDIELQKTLNDTLVPNGKRTVNLVFVTTVEQRKFFPIIHNRGYEYHLAFKEKGQEYVRIENKKKGA